MPVPNTEVIRKKLAKAAFPSSINDEMVKLVYDLLTAIVTECAHTCIQQSDREQKAIDHAVKTNNYDMERYAKGQRKACLHCANLISKEML